MKLHIELIHHNSRLDDADYPTVCEAQALLTQHGQTRVIAEVERFVATGSKQPERVEAMLARLLRQAADWLAAGPVNLRNAGGRSIARS